MSARPWTPGPWRWEVNLKTRQVQLCGGDPKGGYGPYDLTVMGFVRWGMSGAAPEFMDRSGAHPILRRAEHFAEIQTGREHHKAWFQLVNQPDANLIAASPKLYEALDALVNHIYAIHYRDGAGLRLGDCVPVVEDALAALALANPGDGK